MRDFIYRKRLLLLTAGVVIAIGALVLTPYYSTGG